jgi:hypothetical protein
VAQSSLPLTTAPRTITVRLRTLVILALVAAVAGAIWWALSWAGGMQPLATGSSTTEPFGLRILPDDTEMIAGGPRVFGWRPGGTLDVTLQFHNSASVPVTITGVDPTPKHWVGMISGPTLEKADPGTLEPVKAAFRPVRVAADAYGALTLVFHANARAVCSAGSGSTMDSVTVHFTTLGLFHDTQSVPLGDLAAVMAAPKRGC